MSFGVVFNWKKSLLQTLYTIKVLSIGTDRSEQTVQTQIRLLLMEQSDQGLHCSLFHPHLFMHSGSVKPYCSTFTTITVIMIVSQFLEFLPYPDQAAVG